MGLKKTNYEISDKGITLDTAYAFIHRIECDRYTETVNEEVNGEVSFRQVDMLKGVAEFYVQNAPRKNAMSLKPFERRIVHFTCKANENPFVAAYETAKNIIPFIGWEDDIVVETENTEIMI